MLGIISYTGKESFYFMKKNIKDCLIKELENNEKCNKDEIDKDIVIMTLEEVKALPPISEERAREILNFKEDFTDPECPPSTEEQLAEFRPAREVHPELK